MVSNYHKPHTKVWVANTAQAIPTTNTTDLALLSNYYSIQGEESINLEEVLVSGLFSEIHIFRHTFIAAVHRHDVLKHSKTC